jgi:hypothetical protein
MAHHLAALIAEAEAASGNAKMEAEARAADLILRLWDRRRKLHEAADPLGPCREAIEVLSRLRAERNPWQVHFGRSGPEGLLANLFDNMAKIVVGGLLLTRAGKLREIAPPEEAALSPEEVVLREQLVWWEAVITPDIIENLGDLLYIQPVATADAFSQDKEQEALLDLGETGPGQGDAAAEALPKNDEAKSEFLSESEEIPLKAQLVEAWKRGPRRD